MIIFLVSDAEKNPFIISESGDENQQNQGSEADTEEHQDDESLPPPQSPISDDDAINQSYSSIDSQQSEY